MGKDEALRQFNLWWEACKLNGIDPDSIIAMADRLLPPAFRNRKPYPAAFLDIEQFRKAVKDARSDSCKFFAEHNESLSTLVKSSVGISTFRAFHLKAKGSKRRPSDVYREYTLGLLENKLDEFRSIQDLVTYSKFVECAAEGLVNVFDIEANETGFIEFGRAAKMLNLSFKFALKLRTFSEDERNRLISFLHVPLDSFTLQGIRVLATEFRIPSNASMGGRN